MRTKVLLCAAALAASLASSMAQGNVYSLNVVGYVNVTLPGSQFTCLANPLDATAGGTLTGMNDITNLFQNVPGNSFINTWNSGVNDYSTTIPIFSSRLNAWTLNLPMPPGVGVMFYNAGADQAVTFVGQVVQGTYNVGTLGGSQFSMVGSPVPIGGDITNSTTYVGLVPGASDSVATWNGAVNDWNSPVVWSGRTSAWVGSMNIAPGQGFFYYNANAANAWVSNFTVQ